MVKTALPLQRVWVPSLVKDPKCHAAWSKKEKLPLINQIHLNQIPDNYTVEVTNRFKGLHLIDRVPEELYTQVCNTVQEAVIKTIPRKKKSKKVKWLSEEGLQIPEKRREVKGKGEKERFTHLNEEF